MRDNHQTADQLDSLIHRAHMLSFDLREQAMCHREVERRIDEGRTIAREMDRLFRAHR